MPVTPTYPGVYVEEVPSAVRTISGVATSVTAFLGRTLRGPVNRPVTVHGFADFERRYGGLWEESPLGFAVRDFFRNGGGQAIVVRLLAPGAATVLRARLSADSLDLVAVDEGAWGNGLEVVVEHPNPAEQLTQDVADDLGVPAGDLFSLTVDDPASGRTEVHRNLTVGESPRRVDRILASFSRLVEVADPAALPAGRPAEGTFDVAGAGEATDGEDLEEGSYVELAGNPDPPDPHAPYFGSAARKQGIYALDDADLVNLLVLPPPSFGEDLPAGVWTEAAAWAEAHRAMLLVDPPSAWIDKDAALTGLAGLTAPIAAKKNAALFFPRLEMPDPLRPGERASFAPAGAVAGVFARTDAARGVWKAPAGLDATLAGVLGPSVPLSDGENGELNPLGVNCLRVRPAAGTVVWGARTLAGDDRLASEWKYVPVRRLALFIEESLYRGTQWVVFEPNDEPLWAQIRLNVGSFMQRLFRQGAFQGATPRQAYLVKCDAETTTQDDIDRGVVNVLVGFAPLKPAEFVILRIQQLAGQTQT